jgi:predicted DNA-binding protein
MFVLVPRSMGRPPLGMKPTTVRLSLETIRRIQAQIGNRQIASFIREAVENELVRRENPSQ